MDILKRYGIYAALYIAAGVAVLSTHYLQSSPYNKAALDEKITLVASSHISLSQLVDNLPSVFRENPHAAALKISDLRGAFLGAMYDSRRMSAVEYRQFLNTKLFDSGKEVLPGYHLHIWESKRRKLRIVALSLARAQFSEYLAGMSRDYSLHYIIPLYILVGCLALGGLHFFSQGKQQKRSSAKPYDQQKLPRPAQTRAIIPDVKAHPWHPRSGVVAEGSIRTTLAKLRSMAGADVVSLFARDHGNKRHVWRGVLELRGALVVRGEAMECPDELTHDIPETQTTIKALGGLHYYYFNTAHADAQICFVFGYPSEDLLPNEQASRAIERFVHENSRSLLVEHYYENSILDGETGLYSAPYAHFSLKEKILSGQLFSTALLTFQDRDFSAPALQKLVRTAIRILREQYSAETAPLIARGNGQSLIVVFAPEKQTNKNNEAQSAIQKLYNLYTGTGKRVGCAQIQDTAACLSAERVLKILSQLTDQSLRNQKPEIYKPASHMNII